MQVYVDPPKGWAYGFPRMYDDAKDGSLKEFLLKNGYPLEDVEFALRHLRVWNVQ